MRGFIHTAPPPKSKTDTLRQIKQLMKERTEALRLACGNHQSQLARQIGVELSTVSGWFKNGRVSPWGALLVEKSYPKLKATFLRPDIIDWDDIKRPGRFKGRV